jgi:naphthoate synthase
MWFLSRFYTADEADKMGLVNTVVPVSIAKLTVQSKLL